MRCQPQVVDADAVAHLRAALDRESAGAVLALPGEARRIALASELVGAEGGVAAGQEPGGRIAERAEPPDAEANGPSRLPSPLVSTGVAVSLKVMALLLVTAPVWPPRTRTPVMSLTSWIWMVPALEAVLSLSRVTATPDAGFTEPSAVMEMLSGAPEAAVDVEIGVVRAVATVVSAETWPAQTRAVRLTRGGSNRRPMPRRQPADPQALGEKFPVMRSTLSKQERWVVDECD